MNSKDLNQLLNTAAIAERLDATPRINKPAPLQATQSLVDLEHYCIHKLLSNYAEKRSDTLPGWVSSCWWLTGDPQFATPFRLSSGEMTLFLVENRGEWRFCEKNQSGEWINQEHAYGIRHEENLSELEKQRLWLQRDYATLLATFLISDIQRAAKIYGEANFPTYHMDINDLKFSYSSQFGFCRG